MLVVGGGCGSVDVGGGWWDGGCGSVGVFVGGVVVVGEEVVLVLVVL